jgi:adenylate cyclase class 1
MVPSKPDTATVSRHLDEDDLPIDALEIRAVKRRFLALNQDRMRRVQEAMRERQRDFLDLLPLLYHINHPMLPGFISTSTPCGVSDYSPAKRSIEAGKRLAQSFSFQRRALPRYDILAIYLMGSSGTIAYSEKSDFDIWICHRPELDAAGREALRAKADGIESWAESLGLEVHFFIMDDASFRERRHDDLSTESSGSSQHTLLLDEFYRTGLLVCGRYPVWWLVPPEYEKHYDAYVQKLLSRRFVRPDDVLDFGGVAELPAGEFFGATLWQLFKAVDSPYKSVLKILLMESYASEYPNVNFLCVRFKQEIHKDAPSLDRLDPYVLMLNGVEEYLLDRAEHERLELARRCFYIKVNEPMSEKDRPLTMTWRREAMREMVQEWGWSQEKLARLDARESWKIHQVSEERRTLVEELTCSYRALSHFGREHQDEMVIDPADMNLLGRKLYVAFERKAGKVEFVNPGISSNLSEERLAIIQGKAQDQTVWSLYQGNVTEQDLAGSKPLKRTHSLIDLLAWAYFNGLINPNGTLVSAFPPNGELNSWELGCVIDVLQQSFPRGLLRENNMEALGKPALSRCSALIINLARDPMGHLTRQGKQLVSERIDPLSFGAAGESLAVTFDQILVTSWHEVLTFRYTGESGLMDCITDYMAWHSISGDSAPAQVDCCSFSSTRGPFIARRVEEVINGVIRCFYQQEWKETARYLVRVGQHFYVMQAENDVPRYERLDSHTALINHLSRPQEHFSPVRLDSWALTDTPLPQLYAVNRPGVVQLFYQVQGSRAQVHVLDEKGSLFTQKVAFHDGLTLLTQFQRFFESVHYRRDGQLEEAGHSASECVVEYYQVSRDSLGEYHLEEQNINPYRQSRSYFGVQVLGDMLENSRTVFTMYCGDREFSTLEHGDRLFEEVARHVVEQRASGAAYPIYITDIDLSRNLLGAEASSGLQTVHFLNYKKRIEQRLNEVMARL